MRPSVYTYIYGHTCIYRLSFANKIDAMHWKGTNIQCALVVINISATWTSYFRDVSMAQLVASMSGVVLGGVVEVVGSNLARGELFTASIRSVYLLYLSVWTYIHIYRLTNSKFENIHASMCLFAVKTWPILISINPWRQTSYLSILMYWLAKYCTNGKCSPFGMLCKTLLLTIQMVCIP